MADFGIINLQPEGDITSYDPPEALVYEFGTFHDEINDRIVCVMSLLPNRTAKPSIDKLRRTKEKPGAKRSVLKANKAFSKIEIPKDTPVLAELDDNDAMHIPFFQYANPDKYYVLENQGKSIKDILQQSVDLSKLKNRSDATPLTSFHHQDFDLKSDHPSVTFIDKHRASFAGFFTGPILDGHHNVALHGFLQEPVNIAVRSGFNTRVVKLPIGFEMVVPLRSGIIHFDEAGNPERWTTTPAGFKRLPPPPPGDGGLPEFPEVPTEPVGRNINIPPVDPNLLNIPQRPSGTIPPVDPNILNIPQRPSGTIPEPIDPNLLNVPPSLGEIDMPENLPTTQVTRLPVEGVDGQTVTTPSGTTELQRALPTTQVTRLPVEGVDGQTVTTPSGTIELQRALPTTQVTRLPVEGVDGQTVTTPSGTIELQRALPTTQVTRLPVEGVDGQTVTRPSGTTELQRVVEAEPVPVEKEPVAEPVSVEKEPETVKEAEPVPVEKEPVAVKPYVKTATVTPNFREDVIGELANFIKTSGVEIQDVEGELERYQPLISFLNNIAITNTNKPYTIEMPSLTRKGVYDTFVDEGDSEDVVRIAFNVPSVVFDFRIEVDRAPSNVVERIDGRVNIVAVSRPVAFRMKPNPSLLKYVLFLRRGTPVVVARPARFRMEPNESLREFVKIEV